MNYRFSQAVRSFRSSAIRDLMSIAIRPDMITFAGGMPGNDLFPITEVEEIFKKLPEKTKQDAFQYGPTTGYPPLLDELQKFLKRKGFPVETNKLMITTGSLQALNILAKVFIDPGDVIVSENPSFIGAISAYKSYQADIRSVDMDKDGILIEPLKEALKLNPKFVYVTPNFHNPAGLMYSQVRKSQLLEVIDETDIPLIEDDAYGDLYFDDKDKENVTALKVMSKREQMICYTGSFSKIFGPGMRLGWMLVNPDLYRQAELCKQSFDACSPNFTQVLACEFLRSGMLDSYVAGLRGIYRKRKDAMINALNAYFPEEASWVEPCGGFYVWIKLPKGIDPVALLKTSIDKGAVFVTGNTFDPAGISNDHIRLSFSTNPEALIEKGVKIIGDAMKNMMR